MTKTLPLLKCTVKRFKAIFWKSLLFEGVFKLISAFLILPLALYLIFKLINLSGQPVVINFDIFSFAITLPGILTVLIWALITATLIFVEQMGLLIIIAEQQKKKRIQLRQVFWKSILSLPRAINFGLLSVLFITFLLSPLFAFVVKAFLPLVASPSNTVINELLQYWWQSSPWLAGVFMLMIIAGASLFIHLMFVFHVCAFESKKLTGALKSSWKQVRKSFRKLIKPLLSGYAIGFVLVLLGSLLLSGLNQLMIASTLSSDTLFTTTLALLVILNTLYAGFLTIITPPLHMAFLTELYLDINPHHHLHLTPDITTTKLKKHIILKHPLISAGLGILILASATVLIIPDIEQSLIQMNTTTTVTSHRGVTDEAPENTLLAFQKAITERAQILETDVRQTKDGVLVAFHDVNLKRMTGRNDAIADLTLEELQSIDLGQSEQIPTIESILKLAKNKVELILEIKPQADLEEITKKLVELIKQYSIPEQVIIMTQDYPILQLVKVLNPSIRTSFLVGKVLGDLSRIKVDIYSIITS
ncbi:MAG: glycerophosphodiester phosphodiesterase family protein, partial [Candidatus Gracilibacteria bacterium]|nr:glycerophosphodiester phosphodiesterase family protein [Candidatus Gracilibacteria bacterium]